MNIVQTTIGVGGVGIGVIALINPALRGVALGALLIVLVVIAIYLKITEFSIEINKQNDSLQNMNKKIKEFKAQQDVYKKLYKLEAVVKSLKMRKGKFDPGWIIAAVVILVLIYFILKTINFI